MMQLKAPFMAAIVAASLPVTGWAQLGVGSTLPRPELEGFSQTGATSTADLAGRVVLYEFFAFW